MMSRYSLVAGRCLGSHEQRPSEQEPRGRSLSRIQPHNDNERPTERRERCS